MYVLFNTLKDIVKKVWNIKYQVPKVRNKYREYRKIMIGTYLCLLRYTILEM